MNKCLPLLLFLSLCCFPTPGSAQDERDDENPTIAKKKASEWMELLRKSDNPKKRRGILIILRLCGPKTRDIFQEVGTALLNDSEKIVRLQATSTLTELALKARRLADPLEIGTAIEALKSSVEQDSDQEVKSAAAMGLGRIAELPEDERDDAINEKLIKSVSVLGKALKSEDPTTRATVAESLGRMGPLAKKAIDVLIETLKGSTSSEMLNARRFTLYAIRRIGKPEQLRAVTPLLNVLGEKNVNVEIRRDIAETLASMGPEAGAASKELSKFLSDKDVEVRRAVAHALDQFGKRSSSVAKLLIDSAEARNEDDRFVRCHCIHALGQTTGEIDDKELQKRAISVLMTNLTDPVADIRLASVQALAAIGPEPLSDDLLKQVRARLGLVTRDLQTAIRKAAQQALKRLEKK